MKNPQIQSIVNSKLVSVQQKEALPWISANTVIDTLQSYILLPNAKEPLLCTVSAITSILRVLFILILLITTLRRPPILPSY